MTNETQAIALSERLQFGFTRKIPLHTQTEAAECGLACLSMIASYYGYRTDIATLRKRFSLSLKGATLAQLVDIAASLDLSSRPVRLEIEEINQLQLPCILHWDMDHFVVLKEVSAKGVVIHDPAKGVRSFSFAELSGHFTGVALELSPTTSFKKKVDRQQLSLYKMMGKVVGLKRSLIQIALIAVVLEIFSLIGPFFKKLPCDFHMFAS